MIPASVGPEWGAPASQDPRACRNGWAVCWLVALADPADSAAALVVVHPAGRVVSADEAALVAQVLPAAVVALVGAAQVVGADAPDPVDAKDVLAQPALRAPASVTASVKAGRIFAA